MNVSSLEDILGVCDYRPTQDIIIVLFNLYFKTGFSASSSQLRLHILHSFVFWN